MGLVRGVTGLVRGLARGLVRVVGAWDTDFGHFRLECLRHV